MLLLPIELGAATVVIVIVIVIVIVVAIAVERIDDVFGRARRAFVVNEAKIK